MSYASSREESTTSDQYIKDYNMGVTAQERNDYAKAIEFYQKALSQKSDFADAWNNLGYCYRMTAKSYIAKAGDAYAKAIKYAPDNEDALEYQGEYFLMASQLANAYKNYQKLQDLNSDEAKVLKEKIDAILKQAKEILKNYSP